MAPPEKHLDPLEVRLAILNLLKIAWVWEHSRETGRAAPETRAYDERLLKALIDTVERHENGLPFDRQGKHLVTGLDSRVYRLHRQLKRICRDIKTATIGSEEGFQHLVDAFDAHGFPQTEPDLRRAIATAAAKKMGEGRLKNFSAKWIKEHGGPAQAAADLIEALSIRSSTYPSRFRHLASETIGREHFEDLEAMEDEARKEGYLPEGHAAPIPTIIETIKRGSLPGRLGLLRYLLHVLGWEDEDRIQKAINALTRGLLLENSDPEDIKKLRIFYRKRKVAKG